jgi:uncharacterized iron-regulated membrane protein
VKLAPRTYQILWDAHAWSGVVASLPLFVMFFMGPFALFHAELDAWAQPGPAAASQANPSGQQKPSLSAFALQPLLEQIGRERAIIGAERITFTAEPSGLRAALSQGGADLEFSYSAAAERLESNRSDLGEFLYAMHFLGPFPYGIHCAGLASMALLLALVSGLAIQLWRLLHEWFRLRAAQRTRTWTSDLHKVWGVFGLPYQLLYAWTGAVLSIGYLTVEPVFERVAFGGDARAMSVAQGEPAVSADERGPGAKDENSDARGRSEPTVEPGLPQLDRFVARAEQRIPLMRANWIRLEHVARADSIVSVYGDVDGSPFGSAWVVFAASDARVLEAHGAGDAGVFERFDAWFHGLHYGRFGGSAVKLLYALLALASCGVILTGNVIWLERRDPRRKRRGQRVLERLSAGVCAGVVLATAALFVVNRYLGAMASKVVVRGIVPGRDTLGSPPLELSSERTLALEHGVFWATWLIALALPFVLSRPRRVAALELGLAAAGFALAVWLDVDARGSGGSLQSLVLPGLGLLAATCALGGYMLARARSPHAAGSEPDAAHHEAR